MHSQDKITEYEQERKKAWRYLRKGLFFLVVCIFIGQIAQSVDFTFHLLIAESSAIAGWVALWRPIEMFLYDLPELRREMRRK